MTQDEITKLIETNELNLHGDIEHFAALVAAQEREECAKICDDMDSISDYYTLRVELICAQAIRARSNT